MKPIMIEKGPMTPEIRYDAKTKTLEIKGRSYPEDTDTFYKPLFNWIEDLSQKTFGVLNISVRMDYLNTSSTKTLINALYKMEQMCMMDNNQIVVNWYYRPMDDDIQETGEIFKQILKIPFRIIEEAA
jgi:hypothetical protein